MFLHTDNLLEAGLHTFEVRFGLVRMQNLVEFILRCLFYPVSRQTETARTVHQGGHNLLLDGGVVALSIDTVDQLLLQLN